MDKEKINNLKEMTIEEHKDIGKTKMEKQINNCYKCGFQGEIGINLFKHNDHEHGEILVCVRCHGEKHSDKSIKEEIKEILDYLEDEEKHFWENCECKEIIIAKSKFTKCSCEANKNHIYRTIVAISNWLESPSCPLVDEEEL